MTVTYNDMQKLSEIELLSLTLQESPNSQVIQGLLSKINTIEDLLQITMQELKVEGIKPKPANQFLSTIELIKRIYASPNRIKEPMNSPENVAEFLMPQMRYLDREVFKSLYLNQKNRLLFMETISIGSLTSSIVHPREVFKPAIKRSAASVILAHNHPSGDPTASQEDIDVTGKLVGAGRVLGIAVIDHIIIGDKRFVSLKQSGHIN